MRNVRLVLAAVAFMLLISAAAPLGESKRKHVHVAIADPDVEMDDEIRGFTFTRIDFEDLSNSRLLKYQVLVLARAQYDAALADPGKRKTLDKFLNKDSKALAITEGETGDLETLAPDLPKGSDTNLKGFEDEDGDGEPESESVKWVRANAMFRDVRGAIVTLSAAYSLESELNEDLAGAIARWLDRQYFSPSGEGSKGRARAADPANWALKLDTTYSYTESPYGTITYNAKFYKQTSETHASYDWWGTWMYTTADPGTRQWGNLWHTSIMWQTSDTDYYKASHELHDVGASGRTITGTSSVTFEVGMRSGFEGAPFTSKLSQTYSLTDTTIVSSPSYTYDDAYSRHELVWDSANTGVAWQAVSAWSNRISQGECYKVPYKNKVEWEEYDPVPAYYETWVNSWREVCP